MPLNPPLVYLPANPGDFSPVGTNPQGAGAFSGVVFVPVFPGDFSVPNPLFNVVSMGGVVVTLDGDEITQGLPN